MQLDVAIIGAGQAGIAIGDHLDEYNVEFAIFDRESEVGASWTNRWDSLTLFTPVKYSGLGWRLFPGKASSYPRKDEVAEYLKEIATSNELPIHNNAEAVGLVKAADRFTIKFADGKTVQARHVIITTGEFSAPYIPDFADRVPQRIVQFHSGAYQNPTQVPPGQVLVVGGGNSGFQIAHELALAGRQVALSEGTPRPTVPQRILWRDIFWWLTSTKLMEISKDSKIGRRFLSRDYVIGLTRKKLKRAGVRFFPRATHVVGDHVFFSDGQTLPVSAIIWATGFRTDDRWISIPGALDENGALITNEGFTPVPGLFTVGRSSQHDQRSALLGFVNKEALRVLESLEPYYPD